VAQWLYPPDSPSDSEGGGESLRRAALMLHGLVPADREAVLGQLDPVHRVAIEPLLEELAELGLPSDTTLLEELLRSPAAVEPVEATPADVLMQAAAADVERVIASEPPLVVARLLAAGDWPWKDTVLARSALPRQRRTADALSALKKARAVRRTDALEDLLVTEVAGRVAAVQRTAPSGTAGSRLRSAPWARLLRWPNFARRPA
jgi:hypothetical protein